MKTKTFEIDGFVFDLSVETPDHLLDYDGAALRKWEIVEPKKCIFSF